MKLVVETSSQPSSALLSPPKGDFGTSGWLLLRGVATESLLTTLRPFGEPFGYPEERDGAIVHDLRPAAGFEATQSSLGRVAFLPHTDAAFLPAALRPQRLALLGLHNEAGAATLLYPIDEVLANLRAETRLATIDQLAQPLYQQVPPLTFQPKLGTAPIPGHRILERSPAGTWWVAYSAQGTKAGGGPDALAEFEAALAATDPVRIVLGPGDLLIFDNLRCLHGREAIVGPRHLQRVYLR